MRTTRSSKARTRGQTAASLCTSLTLVTTACHTAALSGTGARVQTSQSAPIDLGYAQGTCKSLGYVVGRGGGSFGGGWLANESLVEYAMNDLRNKVGKMGGNYVQHDTPQMGIAGSNGSTTTSTATVSGTAYLCEGSPRAGAASPGTTTASEPRKLTEPPKGAGGIQFAQKMGDVGTACTTAGFTWNETSGYAFCSGTLQNIGVAARTVAHPCSGVVCGVDLITNDPKTDLVAKYDELYGALEHKYGIPAQKRQALDSECLKDLAACVSRPGPPSGASWRWPNGITILIRLASVSGVPAVVLSYSKPASDVVAGPAL